MPGCRDGSLACVARVEAQAAPAVARLDAACDHRAIAALAYLRITEALRADLARREPRFFRDKRWMAFVITDFSNAYFEAFERYERGLPVPESWRIFYDAATKGETNAVQDLLLFSNAHAQHDLPFSYASMGVRTPDGTSHKPDHDGVNEINVRVIPGVKKEIEERYDPSFRDVPGPLDEMAGLEPTKSWREGAWRNAERLVNARDEAEREQIAEQIRALLDGVGHELIAATAAARHPRRARRALPGVPRKHREERNGRDAQIANRRLDASENEALIGDGPDGSRCVRVHGAAADRPWPRPTAPPAGLTTQQLHLLPQSALPGGARGRDSPGQDRHADRVVETELHSEAEQAALRYTEALTRAADTDRDAAFERFHDALAEHFSTAEMLEIVAIVVNMNVWTRIKLAKGAMPGDAVQNRK